MFTGIIENVGTIKAITPTDGDIRLTISAPTMDFTDVNIGDSIASNGICLTAIECNDSQYSVDVSRETLDKTAMHTWRIGDKLNLEKAMLPTTRFGGHIVSGHVDGVGTITAKKEDARSIYFEITIPEHLAKYTATKGSITVDGISLTTNLVKDNVVCLNIIPHTASVTNISKHWHLTSKVNIEVDLIARYLERLLIGQHTNQAKDKSKIDLQFLAQNGFYPK